MRVQGKREAATLARAKRKLTELVLFKNAGFSLKGDESMPCSEDTEKIRVATERYTKSWVIPLIEAICNGDLDSIDSKL
jgi:hypothetical protein